MKTQNYETEKTEQTLLTIPEILTVCEKGIGLRWVKPYRAEIEQREGSQGDMVVISNLQRIILGRLDVDASDPYSSFKIYKDTLDLLAEGDQEALENFADLPIDFREAVKGTLSIAFATKIVGMLHGQDTINSLLEGNYLQHVPSFLLIQREDMKFGFGAYDENNYPPFGKIGTQKYTAPNNILACIGIDKEMIDEIKAEFGERLNTPISTQIYSDPPHITDLYDAFEDALCDKLVNRIMEMLSSF